MSITTNPKRGGMSKPRTGKARDRQTIISDTLKRVPPSTGAAGPAGPPGAPGGVTSYNGRVGVVVPVLGDATLDINAHVAAVDPHTQYALDSDKGLASGYASLDVTTKVPIAQIPTGVTGAQVPFGNDARFSDARTPLAHIHPESDITNLVADLAARVLATDPQLRALIAGYDFGTLSTLTEQFLFHYKRLGLAGAERLTIAGTGNVLITDMGNRITSPNVGVPKLASSFCVPNDYFLDQMQRLSLQRQDRATLQGTADLIISDDFSARSRIVLAGRG